MNVLDIIGLKIGDKVMVGDSKVGVCFIQILDANTVYRIENGKATGNLGKLKVEQENIKDTSLSLRKILKSSWHYSLHVS